MNCENELAPIALFVYSRPWHTRQTIEALQRNARAGDSRLFIFSDAARTPEKVAAVDEVRDYVRRVAGFRSVTIIERRENLGLANSIIDGVSRLCTEHGSVIVLEDDMVTAPYFLTYMNDGLERYAGEPMVASIHGYMYPVASSLPETFFIRGADCWGWATWQRAWQHFNPDGQFLLDELERRSLTGAFDFSDSYPYTQMLHDQIAGRNDSWAVRWYASTFLKGMLTLYPGRSLIQNIGTDGSGSHCGDTSALRVDLHRQRIEVALLPVKENSDARKAMELYFIDLKLHPAVSKKLWFRKIFKIIKRPFAR